ncbi:MULTISPECIES: WD40 repeat domain-containing protein [unclassified Brevundimonas]|uniref:WD40 repeat domain-containing protein n=1 Tax=unclassified Brevundimonas TaxID=2622653 RepID=UPI0025B931E9|nr:MULTISPECIES: WD40 repeat domain-containing protein [unclassified Brevundimonas]
MNFTFDAQITAALFDKTQAVFALGDGSVRFEDGSRNEVHDGAVLCACVHPSGEGIVTGGDDGRVVWSRVGEAVVLAEGKGWIDSIASSKDSGLIAFSSGRTLSVIDSKDATFRRDFQHERTVSGVAFDPKGRRVATSTYNGAWLWYARIEQQQPVKLQWAGSHIAVGFSPDGAFLVTSMQDNQLHGWRLKDQRNMRMGGYPAKIKSFSFLSKGQLLATSGAQGVVLWPFIGANGPMGREATEIGYDESTLISMVASVPEQGRLVAGLEDGRVWWADPAGRGLDFIKKDKGAAITALAVSAGAARMAWADEDGNAGVHSF